MKRTLLGLLAVGLLVSSGGAVADLEDGLVLHYSFDGNAIDQTDHGYDGTVIGATLAPDRFGVADSAYYFDGNDYIVTDATGLPAGERTVSLWMLATGNLGLRPVALGYGRGCGTTWIMYVTETDYRLITHCGGPEFSYFYSCAPKNFWTHYAIRIDGSTSKIYINGDEAVSSPMSITTDVNGTQFSVGVATHVSSGAAPYTDSNIGFFEGSIDDVRVYDRALSVAEIGQLSAGIGDQDTDGVADDQDNCLAAANPTQLDTDADGIGNACDGDFFVPNDCQINFLDLNAMKSAFFTAPGSPSWNPDANLNGDNSVNFLDLIIMKEIFFAKPGPSGVSNSCSCIP